MPFKSVKDLTLKDKLRAEQELNKRGGIANPPPELVRKDDFDDVDVGSEGFRV